jgi:NADPH2:quinone reductase
MVTEDRSPPPTRQGSLLLSVQERSLFLTRPTLGSYAATPDELRHRADDLFRWIRDGRLTVRIGGRYPLEQAARAHEDLAERRTTGKLILLVR